MMSEKKLYIETYGCQMNVADSEVVASVMADRGFTITDQYAEADAILVNTCSVRDNAEKKIWNRLSFFKSLKKKNPKLIVGLIGCMAERIGDELVEKKSVDLVAGPDAYRDLPYLYDKAKLGENAVNVELTIDETYDSIIPKRIGDEKISGFVSITRGCNNFCTYCIVPYTRGRERSRDPKDILNEVRAQFEGGAREVTLLGQNVNSYAWHPEATRKPIKFPDLLEMVAQISPSLRVRFTTSHPKDLSDKLLKKMVAFPNICRHIHLPVQSGSSAILKKMNRKYDRDWYLDRIRAIRIALPGCGITTDIFCGFCTETEEDHLQSLLAFFSSSRARNDAESCHPNADENFFHSCYVMVPRICCWRSRVPTDVESESSGTLPPQLLEGCCGCRGGIRCPDDRAGVCLRSRRSEQSHHPGVHRHGSPGQLCQYPRFPPPGRRAGRCGV